MSVFKFSRLDFLFTCVGLVFLVLDIALDAVTAVDFYRGREWVRLGLLVLFLLGSSLLVQTFSLLWYSYDDFDFQSSVERAAGPRLVKWLHALQLGIYLRHLSVMEMAIRKFLLSKGKGSDPGDVAVCLTHDVAMLRIVETFSESLPQLVLMVTTNIQRGHLDLLPVLKSIGSALAVSFCVTSYHRSLRHFLKDKAKLKVVSSVVYFLWNVQLIAARVAALSLFASVLPCFVLPHFLCSWALLTTWAWRQKTSFMGGDKCGERLFRATVGLIWYFSWFNVVEGRTLRRLLLYHGYILADVAILCGLWLWRTNPDLSTSSPNPFLAISGVVGVYLLGLSTKVLYYRRFHPNVTKDEMKSATVEPDLQPPILILRSTDEVDMLYMCRNATPTPVPSGDPTEQRTVNKRMERLAQNFFSR